MYKKFNFEQSCNTFLNEKNVSGYNVCINSLKTYLKNDNMSDNEKIKIYFQGIRSDTLIDSLNFYIDSNNITSFSAANRYVSCIKEYFLFLIQNEYLRNDELMSEFAYKNDNHKSYRYRVNCFLSNKSEIVPLNGFETLEDIKDLISNCDSTMNNKYYLSKALGSKMYFNKYRSALIIKLNILTGSVYRNLIKLQESDIDLKHCNLTLNGLTIHLPNTIVDQMYKYFELRQEIIKKNNVKTHSLFIEFNGSPISIYTSTTGEYLMDIIGRRDINGIIKYSIINMIKKGINQSIILKFTGVGDTIYNDCQEIVNETMDLKSSSYLDSKLRSMEVFNLL